MKTKALRRAFFEDLAESEENASECQSAMLDPEIPDWVSNREAVMVLRQSITSAEQVEALSAFVREIVHIAMHSALVAIDGGSSSAEVGNLRLVDDRGRSLGDDLHSLYVDYLFETGRIS